ncbi:hypothetical protein K227x_44010 [Rubripirellula lacrimiformis]|uniref:Oxaloacetate decarboxylase, gamma chain n=1 Tax=Rubripirellula lacrimiformis TaxID=1930273 RepID=A0A517NFU1_9BACT|nr:hypothetical protein K227x_44010 [Rubripirellula lacrimiformis]
MPILAESVYGRGLAIAIAGLVIVFAALVLLSLFIASLPTLMRLLDRIWPEVDHSHRETSHPESHVADDGAVLAAIGFVLHSELQHYSDSQKSTDGSKNS